MKKSLRSKILLCVLAGGVLYSPVTNVYAAELNDGPIFGENDNYNSYRTEYADSFIYDFNGDSSLVISNGELDAIYINGNDADSKNIIINDKLDIELTNNGGTLSGIDIYNNALGKTINRSNGGKITINNINSTGSGYSYGARINGGERNNILLGDSDIEINVQNPAYGAEVYGLQIRNGQNNNITMGNGTIVIKSTSQTDRPNSQSLLAGISVNGETNKIETGDVSLNVSATGKHYMDIYGLESWGGGTIITGDGDITVSAVNSSDNETYVDAVVVSEGATVTKANGKIEAVAQGEGTVAARGVYLLGDETITNLGVVDISAKTIGGSTENGNWIDSIGVWTRDGSTANIAGGSITAEAYNSDEVTVNNDANIYAILSDGTSFVNVNQETNNDVVINGNIETRSDSTVKLNLNTINSELNGAIDDNSDNGTTLTLANGAEWNNSDRSNVTNVSMNGGIINQNTDEDIDIENYSGNGEINFAADNIDNNGVLDFNNTGDVTIGTAEASSVTNLSVNTNNTVDTINIVKANENLNAIANKIYYTSHSDGNITGSVKIAEGLITPEVSGDLLFYEDYSNGHTAGQGYVANVKQNSSTTTIDNIKNVAATAIVAWRQEESTLSQRLGELRESDGGQGIWVRMSRGEFEYDGEYKNQYNFFQMGYDWAAGSWHYGAAISHNDGQTTYTHGDGENRSTSLSLYGTWLGDKGHYADIVLKQGRLSNDFDIYTEAGHTSGDYDAWGTSLSGEYGMKVDIDGGWYVTPQAQLTLMRIGGEDYTTNNGIKVNQDSLESAVGRVGFEVGKRISDSGSIYAKASLLHDFAGSADTYLSLNGLTNSYHQDIGDTWCEAGIGFNYKTSENSYVYADVVKTFGGDVETPWQWNAGMRWTF